MLFKHLLNFCCIPNPTGSHLPTISLKQAQRSYFCCLLFSHSGSVGATTFTTALSLWRDRQSGLTQKPNLPNLPGFVWGAWGLTVALGLGRGRRVLCDILLAGEGKASCYFGSYDPGHKRPSQLSDFLKVQAVVSLVRLFHFFFFLTSMSPFCHRQWFEVNSWSQLRCSLKARRLILIGRKS